MQDWRAFVDRQRVAHLASASVTGVPHVIPVCFARLEQTLYVAIDQKPKRADPRSLRRVRNVLENPRVALVADVYDEDWSRLGFVLLHGAARVLEGGAEHGEALSALRQKYEQYRGTALEERPVIAIDVDRATMWGTARALETTS
ncbi:MAG TPA: TIGR03668 family PPOX class F420-dependent oxidoreductase [Chloroflexota bacterium]|nr:TIGR03668 family PPOX class F420-dependent oxidoreductase [Chloroflexota bacterium]